MKTSQIFNIITNTLIGTVNDVNRKVESNNFWNSFGFGESDVICKIKCGQLIVENVERAIMAIKEVRGAE